MSIEKGGNSNKYDKSHETVLVRDLKESKLTPDVVNVWQIVLSQVKNLENLKPAMHYEEYIRTKVSHSVTATIMELSDPDAVAAFDQVVDEFNADLERIKREKDISALQRFVKRGAEAGYQDR